MEKLYYDSAYRKEFEATVLSCKPGKGGYEVILDRTAFYPEGGGQPADTGILGGVAVTDVHERNGEVVHMTAGPLSAGETVKGAIDWDRRFLHMQEHSGEHLVSGLIHARFGYDNVGFHMGSEEVTIDFNGLISWDELMEIERRANGMIWDDREIYADYPTAEELAAMDYRSKKELTGKIRIVKIPGGDVCACCGTHVRFTGEIGTVKFLNLIRYKGGVRITLLCGSRALADYEKKRGQVQKIGNLLSAKPGEVYEAVEKLSRELSETKEKLAQANRELIKRKTAGFSESEKSLILVEEKADATFLRQLANRMLEEKKAKNILTLGRNGEGEYFYVLGSQSEDMRLLSKELNGALHGRGGGSVQMAQGTFYAEQDEICAILKEKGFSSPDTCNGSGARNPSDYA